MESMQLVYYSAASTSYVFGDISCSCSMTNKFDYCHINVFDVLLLFVCMKRLRFRNKIVSTTILIIPLNKYHPIAPFPINFAAFAVLTTATVWYTAGPCWRQWWWRLQATNRNVDFVQKSQLQRHMRILIQLGLSTRADWRPKTVQILKQPNRLKRNSPVKREMLVI